jgi:hypothetical protein
MLDLPDGPSVDVAKFAARNHPTLDAREYLAFGADNSFRNNVGWDAAQGC